MHTAAVARLPNGAGRDGTRAANCDGTVDDLFTYSMLVGTERFAQFLLQLRRSPTRLLTLPKFSLQMGKRGSIRTGICSRT